MSEKLTEIPQQYIDPSEADWSPATYNVTPEGLQNTTGSRLSDYHNQLLTNALASVREDVGTPEQKSAKTEILANGTLSGHEIGMPEVYRDAGAAVRDRIWMSRLVDSAPEAAQILAEREVVGFHATGSYALAGLIEGGALLSGRQLAESGKASISGAHDSHVKGQGSISFGILSETQHNSEQWGDPDEVISSEEVIVKLKNDIDQSESLAQEFVEGNKMRTQLQRLGNNMRQALAEFEAHPNSLAATMMRHKFPVAIGVSRSFVRQTEATRLSGDLLIGQSYYGEFRPAADALPINEVPVIAVPPEKIEPVRKLLALFNHEHVAVVSLEAMKLTED